MSNVVLIKVILLRGDATKTGRVTDCHLRSFSDPLSSADMHHGKKSKQSIYRFLYHHPLITQLSTDNPRTKHFIYFLQFRGTGPCQKLGTILVIKGF